MNRIRRTALSLLSLLCLALLPTPAALAAEAEETDPLAQALADAQTEISTRSAGRYGMVFSTIAVALSFLAKSYTDAPRFNTYIIMPMSFLCNTFFSTEQMPAGFRQVISLLPLSQTSAMIRAIANGEAPGVVGFVILGAYLAVFGLISVVFIYRKKNL